MPVSPRIGLSLRLVLLTGVRVTEMAGAELKEFTHLDGNQVTWSIPAGQSKKGRAHVVPLSSMARAIVLADSPRGEGYQNLTGSHIKSVKAFVGIQIT
jgi:hypothetical protein